MRRLSLLLCLLLPMPAQASDREIVQLLRRLATLLAPRTTPATYYVSPGGSDSAACTQSAPCKTIAHAIGRMVGGDTLYLRAGTYAQRIDTAVHPLPSGLSWEHLTTIAAYPGETVTLKPGTGTGVLAVNGNGSTVYEFIQFVNLIADGTGTTDTAVYMSGPNAHHLRFQGGRVTHGGTQGFQGNCAFCEYLGVEIDRNGQNHLNHGAYLCPSNGLVKGNHFHHNSGYGLHLYDSAHDGCATGTRVEGNTHHDNCTSGGGCGEMTINHGQQIVVANNLVYNAGGASGPKNGIEVSWGTLRDVQVLHNTVYTAQGGVVISDKSQDTVVRNNLLYRTSGVTDRGTGTTQQANSTSDPLYVNAAQGDYHLQAGSPALDAGVAVAGVTTDKDGVTRPQGSAPDIGAYERVVTPVPPQPPTGPLTLACSGQIAQVPGQVSLTCIQQEGSR